MELLIPVVTPWNQPCAPAGFQNFLNTVAEYVTLPMPEAFSQIIVATSAPDPIYNNLPWLQIDGNGRPLGIFWFHNKNWRSVHTGQLFEITMYYGNPANDFDNNSLGVVGGSWDGWALCNGNNGTRDLRNIFVVSGGGYNVDNDGFLYYNKPNQPGYPAMGTPFGGNYNFNISPDNLPTLIASTGPIVAGGGPQLQFPQINALTTGGQPQTINCYAPGNNGQIDVTINLFGANDLGGPTGQNLPFINQLPPYTVLGFVQFVGYT